MNTDLSGGGGRYDTRALHLRGEVIPLVIRGNMEVRIHHNDTLQRPSFGPEMITDTEAWSV